MTFNLALMGHPYAAGVTKIPAAALNYICVSLNNAADLQNGGTFSLLSQLVIQGAGTRFDFGASPGLEISGVFGARVLSGSTLQVNSGGFLTLAATSTTTFTATSIVTGSAKVTLALEATSHITGQVEWDATIKTGSQWSHETGTTHTYDSGALLIMDGTSSIGAGGQFIVSGASTYQTGSVATYQSGSTLLAQSGATITAQSGATVNLGATVSRTGPLTMSGASATTADRVQQIASATTAQTVTIESDTWYVQTPSFATSAVYTLKSTSPAPPANTTIEVLIYALPGGRDIDIQREGGASIIKFTSAGTGYAAARFRFIASSWRLAEYSSDTTVAIGAP